MANYPVIKTIHTKRYEINIHEGDHGCFENQNNGSGGELWFEGTELVDYDGVSELPKEVREALIAAGFTGDCCLGD